MLLKNLFAVLFAIKYVNGSRILGVFPMPSLSHYSLAAKMMKGLIRAGHDVTMISPYKLKDPPGNGTYTDIILDGFADRFNAMLRNRKYYEMEEQNQIGHFVEMTNKFLSYTNNTLHHPNVKILLQSDAKFDAVIMEQFSNDAIKVFPYIYDCPLITLGSMGINEWINPTVGNPQPISYAPHLHTRNFSPYSMLDRARNLVIHVTEYLCNIFYLQSKHEEVMLEAFPTAPPLYELYTNVSLILVNSHTSIHNAVPVVPNMVEIGGYFIDDPKKLPKDLQDFLDNATNGAIYFSMGSNLSLMRMSAQKKNTIFNVLSKLKQRVILKFEEELPGKPANVMTKKWCPQLDILAHPNVRIFITHAGMLSVTEAIHSGVPILAVPVFGDQHLNAEQVVEGGYGLKCAYKDPNFNEEHLEALINELLENSKYKETAQRRSKIYHDRPSRPMDTAVYWVEYVIRHKGVPHLRVAGVRLPWYHYFMLDVIGVFLFGSFIAFYCSVRLVYSIVGCAKGCKRLITLNRNSWFNYFLFRELEKKN